MMKLIIHLCPNFDGSLAKLSLKVGQSVFHTSSTNNSNPVEHSTRMTIQWNIGLGANSSNSIVPSLDWFQGGVSRSRLHINGTTMFANWSLYKATQLILCNALMCYNISATPKNYWSTVYCRIDAVHKNIISHTSGPLFTKKTPSYQYRNSHYKPETVVRPS